MTIKMKEVVDTFAEGENGSKGKPIKLAVKRPSRKILDEGEKIFNKYFMNAYNSNAPLQAKVSNMLKEQDIWNEDKEKKLEEIQTKITDFIRKLSAGGIKKLAVRKIGIEIRKLRMESLLLQADRNELENRSCESQAKNKQFNYFVSACTVDNDTDEPYFESLEDYENRSQERAARDCATKFAEMYFNLNPNFQKELPENKVLLELGFVNDDLHLIDRYGNLCDEDFRRVNEDGRFVLDDGVTLCDRDGNRVDENGYPYVEFKPFLDDDE